MTAKFKLALYAVLILLVAGFGWGFASAYSAVSRESAEAANEATSTPTNGMTNTNGATSNSVPDSTNQETQTAPTNSAPATPTPAPPAAPPKHSAHGRMIGYLAAMVMSIIGLGIMIAYDFTQIVSNVAVDALLDDRGEGMRDPEYERAEQAWADGKHLDAIQTMREFLKKHPREQYAALRIAEIYEKDLGNPLAAALEYEEVLKKKLPAERWGWAAVHLCNLYSKLGQQEKTRALLQRIVDDYPKTAAAKKARSRLGLPEPDIDPAEKAASTEPTGEPIEDITPPAAAPARPAEPAPPPPPPPPKSNLPPGFRPKK